MKALTHQATNSPAIADLITTYGSSLQDMPLDDKLLAIVAIARAMRIGLLDAKNEPSIIESLRQEVGATSDICEVDDGVFDAIAALDNCTELQIYDLMVELSNLATAEFRQFGA